MNFIPYNSYNVLTNRICNAPSRGSFLRNRHRNRAMKTTVLFIARPIYTFSSESSEILTFFGTNNQELLHFFKRIIDNSYTFQNDSEYKECLYRTCVAKWDILRLILQLITRLQYYESEYWYLYESTRMTTMNTSAHGFNIFCRREFKPILQYFD